MSVRPKPRGTRLLVVVLVSISLAVITVDYRQGEAGPLAGLGRTALTVMAPLQRAVTDVTRPIGDFFTAVAHLPSLARENQRLKDELGAAAAQVQQGAARQNDVDRLRALVNLADSFEFPLVNAVVIGNGVSNFESTITIDHGGNAGVAVDMPVVTPGPTGARLVGRVIRVTPISAEVQLITDRDSNIAARLEGTRQSGLLVGQGQGDLMMSFVDPGVVAEPGEIVETNGYQGGLFPPGITIGVVSRFVPATNQLDAFITVRPSLDFSTLDYVAVIQKPTTSVADAGGGGG